MPKTVCQEQRRPAESIRRALRESKLQETITVCRESHWYHNDYRWVAILAFAVNNYYIVLLTKITAEQFIRRHKGDRPNKKVHKHR
jgi:hypothetical protein